MCAGLSGVWGGEVGLGHVTLEQSRCTRTLRGNPTRCCLWCFMLRTLSRSVRWAGYVCFAGEETEVDVQGLAQYRTGRQGSDPGPGTVTHQGSPSLGRPSLVCQEVQDLCQEPPHTGAQ